MTPDEERVWQIYQRHLKDARAAFAETFGVSHTDSSIGLELERLTNTAFRKGDKAVEIPGRIALALLLPEGGAGRKPGEGKRMTPQKKETMAREVEEAICRECELIEEGMKKVEAQKQAAREACERLALDGWHPPSAKSFERLMEEKKSGMNKNLKDRKPRKRRRRKLPS